MNYSCPPLSSRIFNVLLTGGLVLLQSCQSDPIVLNPPGGYEYLMKSFPIDYSSSEAIQGNLSPGVSPRLYSGIISNVDSVKKTVSALIKLLPQVIDSHQIFVQLLSDLGYLLS